MSLNEMFRLINNFFSLRGENNNKVFVAMISVTKILFNKILYLDRIFSYCAEWSLTSGSKKGEN